MEDKEKDIENQNQLNESDMDFFLDQKFNYITTDYPEMLLQKIAKRKANK